MVFGGIQKLEHEISSAAHSAAQKVSQAEHKVVDVAKTVASPVTNLVKLEYQGVKKLGDVIGDLPNEIKTAEHAIANAGHSIGNYYTSHGGIGGIASSVSKNIGDDLSNLIKPTSSAISTPLIAVAVITVVGLITFMEIK